MCLELHATESSEYLILQKAIFVSTCFMNFFLIYVIFSYSSRHMREYKYILLVHVICFLIHDFIICICLCPRSYPEIWAIRQLGLSADFGFSSWKLSFWVASAITEVVGTYTHMLFFRTRVIITETHMLYFRDAINQCCIIFMYSAWIIALFGVYFFLTVDDEKKIEQLKHFNICNNSYSLVVGNDDVVIVSYEHQSVVVFLLAGGISFIIFIFLVCFCVSTYTLFNSHTFLSRKTIALQRSLLLALVLQVIIPLLLMLAPILIVVATPPPAIEMAAFLVYTSHGLLNSVIVLFAHRDYRNVLSSWIRTLIPCPVKKESSNKITCIQKSESGAQYRVK